MRRIKATDYRHYVPEGQGERRHTYIELGAFAKNKITAELRCSVPLVVSLIDGDGQTVFYDEGKVVFIDAVLEGFKALEVSAAGPFCYWFRCKDRFWEVPDPVPLSVVMDQPVKKPIEDLVAEHVRKYLAAKALDQAFETDEAVEELIDDIQAGDLEFEEEPDPFGLGYSERHAEWERAAQEPQEAAQPHAEQNTPASPEAGVPSPAAVPGAIRQGASKPDGSPST